MLAERERRYFEDFSCARLVLTEMRVLHESDAVNSLVWVVMPDHVHWLFHLGEIESLSSVAKSFKARSVQRMNQYMTAVITKKTNCVRNMMYLRLMTGDLKAENRRHLSAIFLKNAGLVSRDGLI